MERFFIVMLIWQSLTAVLFLIGKTVAKKSPTNVCLWWVVLGASFIPLLPFEWSYNQYVIPELFEIGSASVLLQSQFIPQQLQQTIDWQHILLIVLASLYACVVVHKVTQLVKNITKLHALLACAEKVDDTNSPAKLFLLPLNLSPFVYGLINPRIYLPRDFRSLAKAEQEVLLLHELTHIRQKDHIAVFIWRLVTILAWFNPFIAKMEAQFVRAMEYRCDSLTVATHQLDPLVYVRSMLNSLKRSIAQSQSSPVTTSFTSSEMSLADYKRRFSMIATESTLIGNKNQLVGKLFMSTALVTSLLVQFYISNLAYSTETGWHVPVKTLKVNANFGHVSSFRNNRPHGGTDFHGHIGDPVLAIQTGRVAVADSQTLPENYGNVVVINHANGYQSVYAHLDEVFVEQGQKVFNGEQIGTVGESGRVTGPHLHLEILHNEKRLDPMSLLRKE
ncbi:peptidoglycan DD-metalloendopeptidase family protein [Pseudoalteromonas sp. T1lg65]|uniref:peptidoglycan DD-metalloendopeptidase family protein n=1 Tax=Pseudoalteromonas sp. T1lg65 TaxID=2077101 RepID=UPI003F7AEF29